MSIVRVAKHNRYVVVSKETVDEEKLSYGALGLLTYLLSKPDDWQVMPTQLAKREGASVYKVRKWLKELRNEGYATWQIRRGEHGRANGSEWVIFETPEVANTVEKPEVTNSVISVKKQLVDDAYADNSTEISKYRISEIPELGETDTILSTEIRNTETHTINNNNNREEPDGSKGSSDVATYQYDEKLVMLLIGNDVFPPVAARLVTEVSPERIEKEVARLRLLKSKGEVPKPGGWLTKQLRGPDEQLPGWSPLEVSSPTKAQTIPQ